jgi:DNA-nicking Smr family endonuclease
MSSLEKRNFEELIEEYSSQEDIRRAMREKKSGEPKRPTPLSEKLKNYPKPEKELDLHNKTANEAKREIRWFLENAKHNRIRTVRIITGKGLHSQDFKSVLPEITEQKLAELKREGLILSFKKEKTGGSYVVYLV